MILGQNKCRTVIYYLPILLEERSTWFLANIRVYMWFILCKGKKQVWVKLTHVVVQGIRDVFWQQYSL